MLVLVLVLVHEMTERFMGQDPPGADEGRMGSAAAARSFHNGPGALTTSGGGVPRRDVTAARAAEAALEAYDGGRAVAVVVAVDGAAAGRRVLLRETGEAEGMLGDAALDAAAFALARRTLETGAATVEPADTSAGRITLYAEAHRAPDALLIVGAGHIAVPLAQLGALLGYRVTVLDDREDFATPVRFPEAAAVVRADFADPFRDVRITPRTYVVLVTRAHKYDFDCLRRLVAGDADPAYIGMVGSRRRVRAAFQALLEAGVPRERLRQVHAPIGLDIGAETPAEIAVSIAAEMVGEKAKAEAKKPVKADLSLSLSLAPAEPARSLSLAERSLRDRERVLDRLLPEERANG